MSTSKITEFTQNGVVIATYDPGTGQVRTADGWPIVTVDSRPEAKIEVVDFFDSVGPIKMRYRGGDRSG